MPFVFASRTRCAFLDVEPCDKAPRPFGPPRRKVPCGNVCPCSRQAASRLYKRSNQAGKAKAGPGANAPVPLLAPPTGLEPVTP